MSHHRICIVAPEFIGPFPNGGVGTACFWEAFALGSAGMDVTVLYTGPTQRESPEHWETHFAAAAPFRYVDLDLWSARHRDPAGLESFELPCPEARTAELVLAFLRTADADLVMFQEFLGHGARALQARRTGDALAGVRAATTLHSCRQWIYEGMHRLPSSPADLAVDFLERESARLADAIVAPSRHMADWADRHWSLGGASVVPYCYDGTLASRPAIVEHVGPFEHLVFFGRLETRKGLHLFCRALADHPDLKRRVGRVTFLGKGSSVDGLSSEEFIATEMARAGLAWEIKSDLGSFEALSWLSGQRGVLVVTPSLVDNLPYTMIELHCRRIPFVATDIGGIPEVVGPANRHLLAKPTVDALGRLLARITGEGTLTIDYRSGYDVAEANTAHVRFVRDLLAEPRPAKGPRTTSGEPFSMVVTNASPGDLPLVRQRFKAADPESDRGLWERFEDWQERQPDVPAVFVDARVEPGPRMVTRLLRALEAPGIDAVTSYYVRSDRGQDLVVTPLGAALEIGWSRNCFGGPCFAAHPSAFPLIAEALGCRPFAPWPVYAAMTCRGISLSVLPAALYRWAGDAVENPGHDEIEAVIGQYHAGAPPDLDLGWVLKSAIGAATPNAGAARAGSMGRALYERLVSIPDDLICAYSGLSERAEHDTYITHLARLRERLQALLQRWQAEDPQVFVYGAGQHAKLVLALCPEIGRFIAGFIDRRPIGRFLGKPCVTPDQFRNEMADVILYSSREYEGEMYERMRDARVEHARLYHDAPAEPPATTSSRLQRRFGHTGPDLAVMHAMYAPPSWATGYISRSDADFLAEMVAAHRPSAVVELGVASGASSAVILQALDRLPETPTPRTLYSCDITPTCYFDDRHETGAAARALYPHPRARWVLDTAMDGRRLARTLPRGSVDLTFIDANHSHPWPLIDLLHVSAVAKPGSWVVLHDVELPIQHPEYQVYGPRWLFQAWPFAKVKGIGKWTSIGAVQLPADPAAIVPVALSLLERTWEHTVSVEHLGLAPALEEVDRVLRRRLSPPSTPERELAAASGR